MTAFKSAKKAVIVSSVAAAALGLLLACGTADDERDPGAAGATPTGGELTPTAIPPGETPSVTTPEATMPPTPSPTTVPTLSVIPTVPPTPTGVWGISYAQPTTLPLLSEEEAVAHARQTGGFAPADFATLPRERFTAAYVLLTDLHLNTTNDLGTPEARNQPVWIVTVHDVQVLPGGPAPPPGQQPTPTLVTTDVNIVIDAMTGEWVESYTLPSP